MLNKSKFQKEFFDILITSKGFFVEEIGDENNSLWIAMKTLENGNIYSIIISDKNNKESNKNKAYKYLNEREVKFSLFNIVVFNKKIQEKIISSREYNEILIDLHNKKVYSNDEEHEIFLKGIINSIFGEKLNDKSSYYRSFGINEFTKSVIFVLVSLSLIGIVIILYVDKNHISMLANNTPIGVFTIAHKIVFISISLINSHRIYEAIKSIFLHDGIISLIVSLYALYIIIGIIDSFMDKSKCVVAYLISGFFAGIFNFFFLPYVSLTISITGSMLGILGLTLLFSIRERKSLGNWVLINILAIIFINFIIGVTSSKTYYESHSIDLIIGFLVGILLYKNNYLKKSFL
ncbi:MAG: rhomboid family intramembrane serine protease [Clostridium perfringens]|nr:rhomboid family intramembrane serine protease [Clostridium perfringens]